MYGLFGDIFAGYSWDVVLKISVATVFTRCIKSLNLLDSAEVVPVHCTFDVSKCNVIHCNFVEQLCTSGVEKVTPYSDDVLAPPSSGSHWCPVVSFFWSLLLASLPSSFSESSSDSVELDSSTFPNKPLSGFGERSKEQSLLLSLGSICRFFRKGIRLLPQKLTTRLSCLFELAGSKVPRLASKECHCHIRCHSWNQWNLPL